MCSYMKMLGMMFGDNANFISDEIFNFRTHFGGTFKNENKIGKNIRV